MTGDKALGMNQFRRLALAQEDDADLLGRFLTRTDADAFAELVRRYGPLVLGVCRRVLGNGPDADDAFQAAFLVLARKAGSVRNRKSVSSWLFGVARLVSLRARDENRKRREHETRIAKAPRASGADHELLAAVDEELQRLPGRYRDPLVACFLQGRTQDEAAKQLGCSLSTLRRRLEHGQELLRDRLASRGAVPLAGLLTLGASQVSTASVEATTALVFSVLSGEVRAVPATALAQGAIAMMARSKLKIVFVAVLAGLIGGGVAWQLAAAQPPEPEMPPAIKAPEKPDAPAEKAKKAADQIKPGDWLKIELEPFFEVAPLRDRYQVDPNGKVMLPENYGDPIKLDGLTIDEATAAVRKQMLMFLRKCEVKITRTTAPPPTQEERIRALEKEVKELRGLVEELRNKKP